jgi:peptidoglycan/LPS O-acetylase OafA/YrhL
MSSRPEHGPTGPRLAFVDQIRAIAALYVATYHALLVLWPNGGPRPPWYLRWADFGHVAVAVFIVVSGFSLALGPARRARGSAGPYGRFMAKRALRLLPPYWVALAGSIVLLLLAPGQGGAHAAATAGEWSKGPVPARSIPVFGLLLQDVFRVPSPNSPLWSIAVEWHLYFLFPLLVFLGCRFGMGRLVAGAVALGLALHVAVVNTSVAGTTPHFLALFCFGIASAYAVTDRTEAGRAGHGDRRGGWSLVAAGFVWFALLHQWEAVGDVVAGAFVACGLFVLGTAGEPTTTASRDRLRWLSGVGLVSYSLYLVHSPTEKIVWQLLVRHLELAPAASFVVLAVLGIAASLVAARILYALVELPSQRAAQRIGSPPHPSVSSPGWVPAPTRLEARGAGRAKWRRPAPPWPSGPGTSGGAP